MMEAAEFDRVYDSFCAFHAEFAPDFGRKQWRENSDDYLQGLLVQTEERRNAENLAEVVPISARALQRFLTDARWDDTAVTAHLQQYLGPRLAHPRAVWAVDSSGFPKQGKQSVGVAHQYCGALGKVAHCQVGVFLAHVGPRGRALVDKRLYLPPEWTNDPARCEAAGVPKEQQVYRSEAQLALAMLRQAQGRGHLAAAWVTGDDTFGKSPQFRDGVAAAGFHYVLEIPPETPVWPLEPTWETPPYAGRGPRPAPRPVVAERQEVRARAQCLPPAAWQTITVAEGAQGPRTYRFAAKRAALLRLQRARGDGAFDLGVGGGGALADRDRVRDRQERYRPGRIRGAQLGRLASPYYHVFTGERLPADDAAGMGGKRCPRSRAPRLTGSSANCCRGCGSRPQNCCGGSKRRSGAMNERSGRT
jgi:SRSO17 transposase